MQYKDIETIDLNVQRPRHKPRQKVTGKSVVVLAQIIRSKKSKKKR